MKRRCFVLFVAAALVSGAGAQVQDDLSIAPFPIEARPFNLWMDIKLRESQAVFAALAGADFPAMIKSCDEMKSMSKLEGFVRRGTPRYVTQLRAFEFAIDEISNQARQESIEGVTLGFQQLTLSCVNCHKQLRAEQSSPAEAADEPSPGTP